MTSEEEKSAYAVEAVPQPAPKTTYYTKTPFSPTEKQGLAFARAVVGFKDELDYIRSKKMATIQSNTPQQSVDPPTPETPHPLEDRLTRRIRVYRAVQHGLSSILAIIIAVLQGITYVKYQQTKDIPNAWPKKPVLFPTLLLLTVAVMALAFDVCCLIAYYFPGKRLAASAIKLALNLHYWITGVKGISYAVAAAVCRTGFQVGDNKDLWGWCCSGQGQQMSMVNGAQMNCTGNTVAWILAIISIAIEVIGVVITLMVNRQSDTTYQSLSSPAPSAPSADTKGGQSDTAPLLAALDSRSDEVHGALGELTPDTKGQKN